MMILKKTRVIIAKKRLVLFQPQAHQEVMTITRRYSSDLHHLHTRYLKLHTICQRRYVTSKEMQAQLGLHPTAYTLQISRPWPKLLKDSCSLRDYNIHKETTIDIKLLRPITEPGVDQHGLLGGADVDTEVDTSTSSSSDLYDLSDGIPFGPYPSPLFYDEKNTKSATDTDGGEY